MTPHVTMKTIAAQAGVTQATVSMSLAKNPRIPATTRERIQAIAQRLGYQPNPYLSTLMRVRRHGKVLSERPVLALVSGQPTADGWRNHPAPTIRQMREGALERAAARGFRAQDFWLRRDGMSDERFSEMLHARGIEGVLLSPPAEGARPPQLKWEYFSAVSLSVPLPNLTLATVCNDHYFSSLQVARECHARGYRRPGLILLEFHQQRFQGRWEAGVLMAGQMLPDLHVAPPLYLTDRNDPAPLTRWLKAERPDVIITPSVETVPVLLPTLARLRRRVPESIGLAVLAVPSLGSPISGIFQNGARIGATAIDTLVSLIERHEHGLPSQASTVMVEGQWNEGTSLRPHP
ncbi:LacI family DNA-binding transcriptional regulator [Opitutus sp. ER46]|uniref:LacI family DNA-binding transcriptional regulator n=1 Tax=Opitutus sp. ER46 TaxID=2161864 RepID=UPI001304EF85|nr:LacI family DNA-binding transcriptional regulator [Opitutus sp. ER46]